MMKFKMNGLESDMITTIDEMTMEHLQKLEIVKTQEYEYLFEETFEILKVLGISQEMLDIARDEHIKEMYKYFNDIDLHTVNFNDLNIDIEIDGYTYTTKFNYDEDGFYLTGKELNLANQILGKHLNKSVYMLLALVFKREDLTNKEHWDMTHIKFKADKFKDMALITGLPFIHAITGRITNTLNILKTE